MCIYYSVSNILLCAFLWYLKFRRYHFDQLTVIFIVKNHIRISHRIAVTSIQKYKLKKIRFIQRHFYIGLSYLLKSID